MNSKVILSFIACILIILVFGKSFYMPIKIIVKLVVNSILGAFLIFIINLVGTSFDFHIGLNILNSIIVGILRSSRSNINNHFEIILLYMNKV